MLKIILLVMIVSCLYVSQGQCSPVSEKGESPVSAPSDLKERWGVQVLGIRQTAGGYMLDFRYRVIDPDKAAPLFDKKKNTYLLDQASGAKFLVPSAPKVGTFRTTRPPQAGRNYFALFANPGGYVKKGSKVTVVIGDFKAEDLIVQ